MADAGLFRDRVALVERLRAIQPDMLLLRVGDPDEKDVSGLNGEVGLRTPLSLGELEQAVAQALSRDSAE